LCVLSMHSSSGRLRTGAFEDQWIVTPGCVQWCKFRLDLRWCRWRESTKGLCLAGPLRSGETSRLGLRDPVASGVKCRLHGDKKSKTEL
jgi:hypothetical protein